MKFKFKFPQFHPLQREIYEHPARYKVLCLGRRAGKSLYITAIALETALRGEQVAIISPIYRIAKEISFEKYLVPWVRSINKILKENNQQQLEIDLSDMQIRTPSGGTIFIRSADKPDNIRSGDYDLVIFDETAFQANLKNLWERVVRPTLIDRQGKAYFISTPNGYNYFHTLFTKELTDSNWKSWNASSHANPHLLPSEIEELSKDMTHLAIRQEIYAEFTSDGQLFSNIDDAFFDAPIKHFGERKVVIGADFGRMNDSTVLLAMDKEENLVFDGIRLTSIPFDEQEKEIRNFIEKHDPELVVMEENSFGKPIVEKFMNEGYPIEGFKTSNKSKVEIIDKLLFAMDNQNIHIDEKIEFSKVIRGELNSFGVIYTDTTKKYSAQSGHDDTVMALALTNYAKDSANSFFISLI